MLGLVLAASFLLGVLVRDTGGLLAMALVTMASAPFLILRHDRSSTIALALCCVLLTAGYLRTSAAKDLHPTPGTQMVREARVTVLDVPTRYSRSTSTRVRFDDGTVSEGWLPPFPVVRQGDVLRVQGYIARSDDPAAATRPGSPLLVVEHVVFDGSRATIAERLRTALTGWIADRLSRQVPEPASSLTLGVITGDDSGMSSSTHDRFRRAGLSHLTAVSGWNVALVAGFVILLARATHVPIQLQLVLVLVAVWCFAFLVGLTSTVLRAAAMATLMLVARWRGRPADLWSALALATAVMIAANPDIRVNAGFQLSVVATLAVALVLESMADRPGWQQTLVLPLAVELSVTPLLLYHFGAYSLLAPVANLLVSPLVALTMLGGVLVVLLGTVVPAGGEAAGLLAWLPAQLTMSIADWFGSMEWASGETMMLGRSWVIAAYLALVGFALAFTAFPDLRRRLAPILPVV